MNVNRADAVLKECGPFSFDGNTCHRLKLIRFNAASRPKVLDGNVFDQLEQSSILPVNVVDRDCMPVAVEDPFERTAHCCHADVACQLYIFAGIETAAAG